MNDFLEQVGVALIKFADAYGVKTEAMMKNAVTNAELTKYNMERDMEVRAKLPTPQGAITPAPVSPLKPKLAEPIPEPQEEEEFIPEERVKPTATEWRQELLDKLEKLGIEVPARTRTTTLETMLEKAMTAATAKTAPQEQAPAPALNGVVDEAKAREYLKLYHDKFSMAEVGTLISEVTKCKTVKDVAASPNAPELFAKLVDACIAKGITLATKGA